MLGHSSKASMPETAILMDLVSHDIQNNHQAVLSYMDLIMSSEGIDDKVKDYVSSAVTQIRTSSMLIDNLRRFVEVGQTEPDDLPPVSLGESVDKVTREITHVFEPRTVTFETGRLDAGEQVQGGGSVQDLLGNILINIAQLDPGRQVAMSISSGPEECEDVSFALVRIRSEAANLPPGVCSDFSIGSGDMDMSKVSRVSGLFFASRIARAIGADLVARPADPTTGRGCVCEVRLRRASDD